LIVDAVNSAQAEIRVQAYGFSSQPIIAALISAKERGVDVIAILDKSDERLSYRTTNSGATLIAHAGIPVFIDFRPAIAHNKVIVIDRHIVVTGSYNFTTAAEARNAENVTIVTSSTIASQFLSNWDSRLVLSRRFVED
jgi:phosphatidylserine/phosphatidylglycerophosphate/cardiolipin synthase-like enzyme